VARTTAPRCETTSSRPFTLSSDRIVAEPPGPAAPSRQWLFWRRFLASFFTESRNSSISFRCGREALVRRSSPGAENRACHCGSAPMLLACSLQPFPRSSPTWRRRRWPRRPAGLPGGEQRHEGPRCAQGRQRIEVRRRCLPRCGHQRRNLATSVVLTCIPVVVMRQDWHDRGATVKVVLTSRSVVSGHPNHRTTAERAFAERREWRWTGA